jgi:acetyl esterase
MNIGRFAVTSLGLLLGFAGTVSAQERKTPPLDALTLRKIINDECMATQGTTDEVERIEEFAVPAAGRQVRVRLYRPRGGGPFPILAFLHGGAFLAGNLETHDNACRYLCNRAVCAVASVDYRLAPEHKFPAQVEDCYAATAWLAEHARRLGGDPDRLAVIGDSAGAMFAAAVCLMARDRNGPAFRCQVLVNPVLDLTRDRPEYDEGNRIFMASYLKEPKDASHPYASPLLAGTFKGLPPAFVVTAEKDIWQDEGEAYARRLRQDGVAANVYRQYGVGHLGPLWARAAPAAEVALDLPVAFLRAAFR